MNTATHQQTFFSIANPNIRRTSASATTRHSPYNTSRQARPHLDDNLDTTALTLVTVHSAAPIAWGTHIAIVRDKGGETNGIQPNDDC